MNASLQFIEEREQNITRMAADAETKRAAHEWFLASCRYKYSYNYTWMGRPVIQYPEDLLAMQEIIFQVKPDLIIETGIAHGGSLVFYASMLHLLGGSGRVLGIDIEIREHNRREIEAHPMSSRIDLLEGSSTDALVLDKVRTMAEHKRVLVALDSDHTHEHVLEELRLYSPLVCKGSYLVVFDTVIEYMPKEEFFPHRQWGQNNNPLTAVKAFLQENDRFVVDTDMENKLMITVAPGGYLRCVM